MSKPVHSMDFTRPFYINIWLDEESKNQLQGRIYHPLLGRTYHPSLEHAKKAVEYAKAHAARRFIQHHCVYRIRVTPKRAT